MSSFQIIRQVRAFATEIVQVRWTYDDGSTLEVRYTAPPEVTKNARQAPSEMVTTGVAMTPWTMASSEMTSASCCAHCFCHKNTAGQHCCCRCGTIQVMVLDLTEKPPLPPDSQERGGGL